MNKSKEQIVQANTFTYKQRFPLESGETISNLHIRYQTYGTLNENKDNVIWVCHALTANAEIHDWWSGLFGKDNIFDPEKYFIICSNNLGSPYGTSCPNDVEPEAAVRYGLNFPAFTLRDTARAMILLMEHLHLENIHLLMGGSCGGNISLELAIELESRVEHMILLCCSARETPWTIAIHHSQRMALEADPDFYTNKEGAGAKGLKVARAIALPLYRTSTSMNTRQQEIAMDKLTDFKSASYVAYQGDKFVNRFDAQCYYQLLNALDTHNLGRHRGSTEEALRKVKAKTLVIGIDSDLFIPVKEQEFLAEHIPGASYEEVKSMYGHDAFLIETEQIKAIINRSNLL